MANIVPSDIGSFDERHPQNRELETLVFLQQRLGGDYTVFHSVHWSRSFDKFTVFGEVDFVVVNRFGDILLIEQKNGPLDEIDGRLSKHYDDGGKNPVDQVVRAREHIIEKFRQQYGTALRPAIDYLVYCPDHRLQSLHAAGLDRSRIVDASRRQDLADCIEGLMASSQSHGLLRAKVIEFFQHTFHLVPDIHARRQRLDQRFVQLSTGLIRFIDNLEMTPFRLRVVGPAGCGKSMLAAHRYERALTQGRKVLLLCQGRPLASMLRRQLPPGGTIDCWHGFCSQLLRRHGVELDFSRLDEAGIWQQVTTQLHGPVLAANERFDTIIIDEAQSFVPDWWLFLRDRCLREGGEVLWLEDSSPGATRPMPEGIKVSYRARENYRSPYKIARYIQRQFPEFEFEPANGVVGLDMAQYSVADEGHQLSKVEKIVASLLQRGLRAADIVILSCRHATQSVFHRVTALGGLPLRHIAPDRDGDADVVDAMRFAGVTDFMGQEAAAVILVDVDLEPGEQLESRRRTAFSGMTRATLRLDIVNVPPQAHDHGAR